MMSPRGGEAKGPRGIMSGDEWAMERMGREYRPRKMRKEFIVRGARVEALIMFCQLDIRHRGGLKVTGDLKYPRSCCLQVTAFVCISCTVRRWLGFGSRSL